MPYTQPKFADGTLTTYLEDVVNYIEIASYSEELDYEACSITDVIKYFHDDIVSDENTKQMTRILESASRLGLITDGIGGWDTIHRLHPE